MQKWEYKIIKFDSDLTLLKINGGEANRIKDGEGEKPGGKIKLYEYLEAQGELGWDVVGDFQTRSLSLVEHENAIVLQRPIIEK